MKYSIEFSQLAEHDLLDIFDYIAKNNPLKAINFVNDIKIEITDLTNFPNKFKKYKGTNPVFDDCRILICKSYKVYYKIIENIVYIVQIKHSARDIK